VPSLQWINSWWWAEELPVTCRVSCRSKFGKLVYLVGFIIKKMADYFKVSEDLLWLNSKNYIYIWNNRHLSILNVPNVIVVSDRRPVCKKCIPNTFLKRDIICQGPGVA
jgi:hypothetical protein